MESISENIRCGRCYRLLARYRALPAGGRVILEFKCPRCGTVNNLILSAPRAESERPRAPSETEGAGGSEIRKSPKISTS